MQTLVFMVMGLVAFVVITQKLGGPAAATAKLSEHESGALRMARDGAVHAEGAGRIEKIEEALGPAGGTFVYIGAQRHFVAEGLPLTVEVGDSVEAGQPLSEGLIGKLQFLTYCFIPLSVGMFPHLFQHWLTARRASNFKLTVVAHPLCIMVTWVPCVLLGMWASGILPLGSANPNAVLGMMVSRYSGDVLAGLIGAGILAAIMSSMDSQFLCVGSLFTNDIAARYFAHERITDRQRVLLGRGFVIGVVSVSYLIGLLSPQSVFDLGVWCFTGFASLFPLVVCALYWKRSNKYGAMACVATVAVLWTGFLPKVLAEGEFLILGMMPVTFLLAVSTLAMVGVTLVTPAPDAALVEKFFPASKAAQAPAPAREPVTP